MMTAYRVNNSIISKLCLLGYYDIAERLAERLNFEWCDTDIDVVKDGKINTYWVIEQAGYDLKCRRARNPVIAYEDGIITGIWTGWNDKTDSVFAKYEISGSLQQTLDVYNLVEFMMHNSTFNGKPVDKLIDKIVLSSMLSDTRSEKVLECERLTASDFLDVYNFYYSVAMRLPVVVLTDDNNLSYNDIKFKKTYFSESNLTSASRYGIHIGKHGVFNITTDSTGNPRSAYNVSNITIKTQVGNFCINHTCRIDCRVRNIGIDKGSSIPVVILDVAQGMCEDNRYVLIDKEVLNKTGYKQVENELATEGILLKGEGLLVV